MRCKDKKQILAKDGIKDKDKSNSAYNFPDSRFMGFMIKNEY
jgi:hypothetical protein